MRDTADPFLAMLGSYKAAVLAKDVDAFAALYHDEVQVFDTWGRWSVSGIAAWRAMVSDWFSSLGAERVVIDANERARRTLASSRWVMPSLPTRRSLRKVKR